MSTTCLLLLARCCCTCALLLSCLAASIIVSARTIDKTSFTPQETTYLSPKSGTSRSLFASGGGNLPSAADSASHTADWDSKDLLPSPSGKCQFNLTQASISVSVQSVQYEDLGFRQCQYVIWAPARQVILLNVSQIDSGADMQVVDKGNLHHQREITTPTSPSPLDIGSPLSTFKKTGAHGSDSTSAFPVKFPFAKSLSSTPSPSESASTLSSKVNFSVPTGEREDISVTAGTLSSSLSSSSSLMSHEDLVFGDHSAKNSEEETVDISGKSKITTKDAHVDVILPLSNTESTELSAEDKGNQHCVIKLIIEGASGIHRSEKAQVICWQPTLSHPLPPLIYHYSRPIRITFEWAEHSLGSFSLDYSFLAADEVNCAFECGDNLCLTQDQVCDEKYDCPDHSDEVCTAEHDQDKDLSQEDQSVLIKVVVPLVSLVLLLIVGLVVFMISRARPRRGRGPLLAPPNSHSSEVCCSTNGSGNEPSHYDQSVTLLEDRHQHNHPPRYPMTATDMGISTRSSEREQLLHQHTSETSASNGTRGRLCSLDFIASGNRSAQQQRLEGQKTHQQPCVSEQYPVHVPISGDGEEGYAKAQRALIAKRQQQFNLSWLEEPNIFRPPPNKTVFDRDLSPPPYSAQSLDSLIPSVDVGGRRYTQRLGQDSPPCLQPRSYSLSYQRQGSIQQSHVIGKPPHPPPQRHHMVHGRQGNNDLYQPPPDYNTVVQTPSYSPRLAPIEQSGQSNSLPFNNVSGQMQRRGSPEDFQNKMLQNPAADNFEAARRKSNECERKEAETAHLESAKSSSCVSSYASPEQTKTTRCSKTSNLMANNNSDNQLCVHVSPSAPSSISSLSSNSSTPSSSYVVLVPPMSSLPPPQSSSSSSPDSAQQIIGSDSPKHAQHTGSTSKLSEPRASTCVSPSQHRVSSTSSSSPQTAQHIDLSTLH